MPDLDAFTLAFFNENWDIFKEDLDKVFSKFRGGGWFGFFKKIYFRFSRAFIMGRQFFDQVFIVNEATDDYRSSL